VKTDKLSITLILKFASKKFSTVKAPQLKFEIRQITNDKLCEMIANHYLNTLP